MGRSRSRSYSRSVSRERSGDAEGKSRSPSYSKSRSKSRSVSRSRSRSRSGSKDSRSVSPLSNRKRHVGDRDEPPASKVIGVFGLNLTTTDRELRRVFEKFGKIDDAMIIHDRKTGMSRGFGFVYYQKVEDAIEAKEETNGVDIEGKKIRVDFSVTKRPHTPTPGQYMGRATRHNDRSDRYGGSDRYDRGYNDRYGGGRRYGGGGSSSRYSRRERSYSRSRSPSPKHRRRSYSRSVSRSPPRYRSRR